MITKKQLKSELATTKKAFEQFKKDVMELLHTHEQSISELADVFTLRIDTISGKQAAKMLGWKGYVKASWLEEKGIRFWTEENGTLHINRTSMENYVKSLNK